MPDAIRPGATSNAVNRPKRMRRSDWLGMKSGVIIARPGMTTRTRLVGTLVSGWLLLAGSAAFSGDRAQAASQAPDAELFETEVRPLLVNVCFRCHTDDEEGSLRLDSRESMLKGGESGPAIVPGDPDASLMIKAVRHQQGAPKMPRKAQQLTDQQIDALARWIKMG